VLEAPLVKAERKNDVSYPLSVLCFGIRREGLSKHVSTVMNTQLNEFAGRCEEIQQLFSRQWREENSEVL